MNRQKVILGFTSFLAALWLLVVSAYAAQVKREGDSSRPALMSEGSSCSSSSGGEGEE